MTNYTLTHNPAFGSIEIAFDRMPSPAVRAELKTRRFKWHTLRHIWYGYAEEDALRASLDKLLARAERIAENNAKRKAAKTEETPAPAALPKVEAAESQQIPSAAPKTEETPKREEVPVSEHRPARSYADHLLDLHPRCAEDLRVISIRSPRCSYDLIPAFFLSLNLTKCRIVGEVVAEMTDLEACSEVYAQILSLFSLAAKEDPKKYGSRLEYWKKACNKTFPRRAA